MVAGLQAVMARLLSAHRQGLQLALLFDYDGTLTPIAEHPALARLGTSTLRILQRLNRQRRVKVGIISGRSLPDLRRMVGLPGLYYAGNSGLELDLLGRRIIHPEAEAHRTLVKRVVRCLGALATDYSGAWVEDKRLGLTLHYRKTPPDEREPLLARAGRALQAYATHLRIVEGLMAWEITPSVGSDKGSAVRLILESIGRPAVPVYVGDAANDTEAVVTTAALGGVALGIGPFAPAGVHFRLRDPATLARFLASVTESLDNVRRSAEE